MISKLRLRVLLAGTTAGAVAGDAARDAAGDSAADAAADTAGAAVGAAAGAAVGAAVGDAAGAAAGSAAGDAAGDAAAGAAGGMFCWRSLLCVVVVVCARIVRMVQSSKKHCKPASLKQRIFESTLECLASVKFCKVVKLRSN